MRRFLKLLHLIGSAGYFAGIAAYLLFLEVAPDMADIHSYHQHRETIYNLSAWIIMPSMILVILSGLLSIAVHRPFHSKGWVWVKALTGILILEASLSSIDMPAKKGLDVATQLLEGTLENLPPTSNFYDHPTGLWTLLILSLANIILGVWRPRIQIIKYD